MSFYSCFKKELLKSNSPYIITTEHALQILKKEERIEILKSLKEKKMSKKEEKVLLKLAKIKIEDF